MRLETPRTDRSRGEGWRGRRRRWALLFAAASALLVALGLACGESESESLLGPAAVRAPQTLRETAQGRLVGFESLGGAHVWRGIPFATPPVGELRWKAPRPPQPWQGTLEALEFAAACPQYAGPLGAAVEGLEELAVRGSEDCLFLNVYTPPFSADRVPRGAARLPVMVWIHGGGNSSGHALYYDGSPLAVGQQVVVVTIQYRLGMLGWFFHPALHDATTGPEDRSGNFGTLDATAALRWVRENIAAFGGDPGNVTVFGESAGGSDILALLVSPQASGLFHRAILQSAGGSDTVTPAFALNAVDAEPPGHPRSSSEILYALLVADGSAPSRAEALELAAGWTPEQTAAYLRSRTVQDLFAVFDGRNGGMYELPTLVRDGHVLPAPDPRELLARGEYNAVPVVFGTNRDERKLFRIFDSPHLARVSGVPLWFKSERMYDLDAEYSAKMWKAWAVDELAATVARAGRAPAFAYRFDWDEEGRFLWLDLAKLFGASHGFEIPFVFGSLDFGPATDYFFPESRRAAATRLSEQMMSYWAQFAYAGDPGRGRGGDLPPWEPWGGARGRFIVLDTEAGGGVRMSDETLDRETVLAQVGADDRFERGEERCEIYAGFARRERISPDRYASLDDGRCAGVPIPAL